METFCENFRTSACACQPISKSSFERLAPKITWHRVHRVYPEGTIPHPQSYNVILGVDDLGDNTPQATVVYQHQSPSTNPQLNSLITFRNLRAKGYPQNARSRTKERRHRPHATRSSSFRGISQLCAIKTAPPRVDCSRNNRSRY